MPRTYFHLISPNQVEQLFWGRVKVEKATALFFYRKGSRYQQLLYSLKYKGNAEIGIELGKLFGADLNTVNYFGEIDYIVPVPLHPKKERKRGYNQSLMIAKGLEALINKPIVTGNLVRKHYSETQTRKGRFERWENVSELFQLENPEQFESKHILLIDDVITTGSTIEACATAILQSKDAKVSVAAIGYASL
jgi:ComF family protein